MNKNRGTTAALDRPIRTGFEPQVKYIKVDVSSPSNSKKVLVVEKQNIA